MYKYIVISAIALSTLIPTVANAHPVEVNTESEQIELANRHTGYRRQHRRRRGHRGHRMRHHHRRGGSHRHRRRIPNCKGWCPGHHHRDIHFYKH